MGCEAVRVEWEEGVMGMAEESLAVTRARAIAGAPKVGRGVGYGAVRVEWGEGMLVVLMAVRAVVRRALGEAKEEAAVEAAKEEEMTAGVVVLVMVNTVAQRAV